MEFEIKSTTHVRVMDFYIQDENSWKNFLHSDGSVYRTVEYFPTKEAAQKILDKYYLKPKHEWEHGDVFQPDPNGPGIADMMYLCSEATGPHVIYLVSWVTPHSTVDKYLKGAKFLFNINDVIKEKS